MKATGRMDVQDAVVVIDDMRHVEHAVLASLVLQAVGSDDKLELSAARFVADVDGVKYDFGVCHVVIENTLFKMVVAIGEDHERDGDVPMCAIVIDGYDAVRQKFYRWDQIEPGIDRFI